MGSIHLNDATAVTVRALHIPATGREESQSEGEDYYDHLGVSDQTPGYTPALYKKYHEMLNDHRESGHQFPNRPKDGLVSSSLTLLGH